VASVTYDEAPRPRVLLSDFSDLTLIEGLVPTSADLTEAGMRGVYRAEDWDAVVAVGRPKACERTHRVVQFGGSPLRHTASHPGYQVWLVDSVGTTTILTDQCPEEFREELKNSVIPHVRAMPLPRKAIDPPAIDLAVEYFIPLVTDADGNAFAAIYKPVGTAEEVIYLPDGVVPSRAWISLAFERWAKVDPDTFPVGAEWTHQSEWMTGAERAAVANVEAAERELAESTEKLERELVDARRALDDCRADANANERLLLMASGPQLVDAVASTLRQFGFEVEDRDATSTGQKLEDLRVTDGEWVAIAEVKGYTKGGTTKDLLSLGRFSRAYQTETGKSPDAQWYIVNQFRERDPSGRMQLLRGQDDDVEAFAEDDGVAVDTRSLFRLHKAHAEGLIEAGAARNALRAARGRFEYP
jgi:hypothetical protein